MWYGNFNIFNSSVIFASFDSWQSEYPKYTPLLAKILESLLSQNGVKDKIHHYEEVACSAIVQGYICSDVCCIHWILN